MIDTFLDHFLQNNESIDDIENYYLINFLILIICQKFKSF